MESSSTISVPASQSGGGLWPHLRSGSIPLDGAIGSHGAFALVLFQAAVLYWVLHRFKIETDLFRLMIAVGFVGFAVHHFLPRRIQPMFFLALSMLLTAYCLGLERAVWKPSISLQRGGILFAVGMALIGICRLRVGFYSRVLLLLAAAGVLGLFRASVFQSGPLDAIWPVLAGMFMYRLACYLYDFEHEKIKSSWVQACSYFFLFPNVWLFVFPMIDYKNFVKEYFNGQPLQLYQRGLVWMTRGVIQLLIWRLLYYQFYVDPAKIANGADLAQFVLSNVGMYLRVTGQFHFAVGLLHLFGYALPESNRRYFLATGFVDYWRRANIYMKDFLMKICYYPLVVRCKKLGTLYSVVAAIAGVFVVTWFLHSYQWFWIRGTFPLSLKDALFWALLGGGVIVNSVRDMKRSRMPRVGDTPWKAAMRQSLSAGATFLVITTLWSIWTCDSLTQWVEIWKYADRMTLAIAAVSFAVVVVLYLVIESPVSPWNKSGPSIQIKSSSFRLKPVATLCLLPAALLIAGSSDRVVSRLSGDRQEIVKSLFWNTPNKSGEEFMVRGYYEGLMDTARFSPALEDAMSTQPKNWMLLERTAAVTITNDLRTRALVPNVKLVINDVPFETNRWGMRDRDYEMAKPVGTTRLAVLGSSITMGWNVPKELSFEALLEKELGSGGKGGKVEVLNFAVNGYSIVSLAEQMDAEVVRFRPDAAVVVSHPEDPGRAVFMLAKSLEAGYKPTDGYLRQVLAKAGVSAADPRNRIERKLSPFKMDLTRWAYESIAASCKKNRIEPWLVLLPGVLQRSTGDLDLQLVAMAKAAGFEVIPLHEVYSSEPNRDQLAVAPWDAHPNAKGHRLVASALLSWIRDRGVLQFGNSAPSDQR